MRLSGICQMNLFTTHLAGADAMSDSARADERSQAADERSQVADERSQAADERSLGGVSGRLTVNAIHSFRFCMQVYV